MSSTNVTRPIFYEGQILASADLTATVDYARQQMARHECFVHIPGIITGLSLQPQSKTDSASKKTYVTVSVAPGIVADSTGRQTVVSSAIPLDPNQLLQQVNPQAGVFYPVFLECLDQQAPASSSLTGACNAAQSTRMQEASQITYGPPGSELALPPASAPGYTSVPGSQEQVLLGFVKYDPTIAGGQFVAVQAVGASGVGPQYVGVNAAEVESQTGSLLLSTHPPGYTGANPVMGVQITEANGGQLIFGKVNPDGSVTPGAIITSQGLVPGAVAPGTIQAQSGIACDGMILPLPLGISLSDIGAKEVAHIHVSLRMSDLQPPAAPLATPTAPNLQWVMVPHECWVDPTSLQVHCRVKWVDPSGVAAPQVLAALCDYTVIVAVPASGGGS